MFELNLFFNDKFFRFYKICSFNLNSINSRCKFFCVNLYLLRTICSGRVNYFSGNVGDGYINFFVVATYVDGEMISSRIGKKIY